MLHEYDQLAAAEVSSEDAIKKMKKFYQQIDSVEDMSAPSTSKMVDEENFTVVISSDEKEKADKSDNNDFVMNDEQGNDESTHQDEIKQKIARCIKQQQ